MDGRRKTETEKKCWFLGETVRNESVESSTISGLEKLIDSRGVWMIYAATTTSALKLELARPRNWIGANNGFIQLSRWHSHDSFSVIKIFQLSSVIHLISF